MENYGSIKGELRQTKIHLSHFWLGQNVGEEKKGEKKRKKRKEKEKEKKTKTKACFVLKSWVFWIPKALVWRIVLPLSRVLWKDHLNP